MKGPALKTGRSPAFCTFAAGTKSGPGDRVDKSKSGRLPTGATIAGVALLILTAALGWRVLDNNGGGGMNGEAPAAMSTPLTLDELREAAEAAPDDPVAWQQLGFAYFTRNMFAEATEAYGRATQLEPESAELWSALGEARVMASESDPLPDAALEAFRRSVGIDPGNPRARYFLAVEKDLAGNHEGAIADWLALLADTPPGAPWERDLVRTIEQVGELRCIEVASRIDTASAARDILPMQPGMTVPGPTTEQMAAAASLSPGQQQDMAEDMVARLAARLEEDPQNIDGWIMLMRSYVTLGRTGQARDALSSAIAANPQSEAQLRSAAETLGL
jgi:cytochrome c-type biogenesis protein CcmH